MTVLLIDGVGRSREIEIDRFALEIHVAIQPPLSCLWAPDAPIADPVRGNIAIFALSPELSYPPVYRFTGIK